MLVICLILDIKVKEMYRIHSGDWVDINLLRTTPKMKFFAIYSIKCNLTDV